MVNLVRSSAFVLCIVGIFHLCKPDGLGMTSFIGMLHLPNMDMRVSFTTFFDGLIKKVDRACISNLKISIVGS